MQIVVESRPRDGLARGAAGTRVREAGQWRGGAREGRPQDRQGSSGAESTWAPGDENLNNFN